MIGKMAPLPCELGMTEPMTSTQRVQAALNFQPFDYVPLFDQYWGGFVAGWRERRSLPPGTDLPLDDIAYNALDIQTYYHIDLFKIIPDEDPWPGIKMEVGRNGDAIIERDGWGRLVCRKETSPYGAPVEVRLVEKGDLDKWEFEPAGMDKRYAAMLKHMQRARQTIGDPYIFIKVGGPFLRSSWLRGEYQWYLDIVQDPPFTAAVVSRVTDHLIAVGIEALKRSGLDDPSIWIFDDIASNNGLMISPKAYNRLFLPQVRRMVEAFKEAGAAHVGYHSDGDLRLVLEGLVDAGISILNPVEPRANMDVVELRRQYGDRLAFVGGLCNSLVLPGQSDEKVRNHVEHVLSIANEGGLVIGSHSISNDITQERYEFFMDILCRYGRPKPGCSD